MEPARSDLNLTPSSRGESDPASEVDGVELPKSVHGQVCVPAPTVTVTPAEGVSMLPLSSVARLRRVAVLLPEAVQVKVQLASPVAGCQVAPLSVDTSMPATTPPTSVAVPWIVTLVPVGMAAPATGEVMTETGGVVSVEAVALVRPDCSVTGWTPMSANRFTVACFIAVLVVEPRSVPS